MADEFETLLESVRPKSPKRSKGFGAKEIDDLLNGEHGGKVRKFFEAVKWAEGGQPDLIVGGQKRFDTKGDHPNIVGMRTKEGPSTAAGDYQITGSNWYGSNGQQGLKHRLGAKSFDPENQMRAALLLFADRDGGRGIKALQNDDYDTALEIARKDWAALPGSTLHKGRNKTRSYDDFMLRARGTTSGGEFEKLLGDVRKAPPTSDSPAATQGRMAIGDSIAAGLIWHGGIAGAANRGVQRDFSRGATASVGSTPKEILANIQAMRDGSLSGQQIILSTGASNDPRSLDAIQAQIDTLRKKGAANITVLGVGPHKNLVGVNERLAKIAQDNGIAFTGPLKTGKDQIHPTHWGKLAGSLPNGMSQPSGTRTTNPPEFDKLLGDIRGGAATSPTFAGTQPLTTPPPIDDDIIRVETAIDQQGNVLADPLAVDSPFKAVEQARALKNGIASVPPAASNEIQPPVADKTPLGKLQKRIAPLAPVQQQGTPQVAQQPAADQPPGQASFVARVDPEFDTGAADKNESVFRQAVRQWGSNLGRPLNRLEEEALVAYQQQARGAFNFAGNDPNNPADAKPGEYTIDAATATEYKQFLDENQEKFAADRTNNLREFLAAGGELTDEARTQFKELGFTDQDLAGLTAYGPNEFTLSVEDRQNEYKALVDKYRQAPDEDTRMNAMSYARRAMGWITPQQADDEVRDYYTLKAEKAKELGQVSATDPFAGTQGRSIAMAGGLEQRSPDQKERELQDYLVRTIGKYGTATQRLAVQKQEALAEAARQDRVAQMSWPEYIGRTVKDGTLGIAKSAASIAISSSLRGIAELATTLDNLGVPDYYAGGNPGSKVSDKATYKAAQAFDNFLDYALPTNKDMQGEWLAGKLPQAIGSSLGMALSGAAKTPKLAIAVMSALQMGGDGYKEAIESGATEEEAQMYGLLSAPLGITEIAGIGGAITRLNKGSGGTVWRKLFREALNEGRREVPEELFQEGFQTSAQNLIANLTYDPDRKFDKGVAEAMLLAGVSAGLVSSGVTALNIARNRHAINKLIKQEQANGVIIKSYGDGELYVFDQKVPITPDLAPMVERYNTTRIGIEQIQDEIDAIQRAGRSATKGSKYAATSAPFLQAIWNRKAELAELQARQVRISTDIAERSGVGLPEGTVGDTFIPNASAEDIAAAKYPVPSSPEAIREAQAPQDQGEPVPTADTPITDAEPIFKGKLPKGARPVITDEMAQQIAEAGNLPAAEQQTAINNILAQNGNAEPIGETAANIIPATAAVPTSQNNNEAAPKVRPPITLQGIRLSAKGQTAASKFLADTDVQNLLPTLGTDQEPQALDGLKKAAANYGLTPSATIAILDRQRTENLKPEPQASPISIDRTPLSQAERDKIVAGAKKSGRTEEQGNKMADGYVGKIKFDAATLEAAASPTKGGQYVDKQTGAKIWVIDPNSKKNNGGITYSHRGPGATDGEATGVISADAFNKRYEAVTSNDSQKTEPTGPTVVVNLVGQDGLTDAERKAKETEKPKPSPMQQFLADDKAGKLIQSVREGLFDGPLGKNILDEITQIGKNHGLSESEVQGVIDRAREKKQRTDNERKATDIVRETRRPTGETLTGAATTILTPESGKSYEARYVIREAEDVFPSHNPVTFQPNPDYYFTNDRHYDREEQYQKQVIDRSTAFKPQYFVTDTPTAADGPPVIDVEGNVLGGNSRAMILQRIYEGGESSSARTAYILALHQKAKQFGLSSSDIDSFQRPVLVRELSDDSINKQHAITELNEVSTTDLTTKEQAVADAGKLTDEAVDYITAKIEVTGAEATLTEALNAHGPAIVNRLIDEGVFGQGERNTLLDDGKITEDGKKRIERLLLGKVFTDLGQIENTAPSVKNTLVRIISPLMKVNSDTEWNILPEVQEGIELLNEANASGQAKFIDSFAANVNFLRPQGWSPQAIGVAKVLASGMRKATDVFKQYAEDMRLAKYGEGAMFEMGAKTQAEAYKDAFKTDVAEKSTSNEKPKEATADTNTRVVYRLGWANETDPSGLHVGDSHRVSEHIYQTEQGLKSAGDTLFAYRVPNDELTWIKQPEGNAAILPSNSKAELIGKTPADTTFAKRHGVPLDEIEGEHIRAEFGQKKQAAPVNAPTDAPKFSKLEGSLGISRSKMPQIKREHFETFKAFAEERGATITEETVAAADLKPTQNEYNPEQAAQLPASAFEKPLMVSNDNRVLDGHNTLVRLKEDGGSVKIRRIDLPALEAIELMKDFPQTTYKSVRDTGATPDPVLTYKGISIQIEPLPLDGEKAKIQEKTIAEVVADPQKWLDLYDAHPESKGGIEINADIAKELFDEYDVDPLSRVSAVHEASSLIANLAYRLKLQELPPNSEILFLAGGGGSGKGFALKNVVTKKYPLIFDGVMKTPAKNAESLSQAIDAGHVPEIVAVITPVDIAAQQNVRRSIGSRRLVPGGPLIGGHTGFRKAFTGGTSEFAKEHEIGVRFLFNDGINTPTEISFAEFQEKVYSEDGQIENLIKEATYAELQRGEFKNRTYDPRLRDAFDGKAIETVDTRTDRTEQGPDGRSDTRDDRSDGRGQQRTSGLAPPAPAADLDMDALFEQAAGAKYGKSPEQKEQDDAINGLIDAFGFDDVGLKSVIATFDEDRYTGKIEGALDKAFATFKAATPQESMGLLLDALETNGLTEKHIREMKPYIVRFMKDKFTLQSAANESISEVDATDRTKPERNGLDSNGVESPGDVQGTQSDGQVGAGLQGSSTSGTRNSQPNAAGSDESGSNVEGTGTGTDAEGTRTGTDNTGSGDSTSDGVSRRGERRDYVAPVGSLTREGSWKVAAANNLDAIELAKKIEAEDRLATPEEQAQLVKFVGWGASELANNIFKDPNGSRIDAGWKDLAQRLRDVMTPEEIQTAERSTQYAHYTSEKVIRGIWSAVEQFGFQHGSILEPGMGNGLFAVAAPKGLMDKSAYTGIEMDHMTARIAQLLLPDQAALENDFIKQKLPMNHFDVAIGNPPFSSTKILADPKYKKYKFALHDYFFAKSIDAVRPGGLMIFITSRYTMDKLGDAGRSYMGERADLLGAIRLPQTAFKANAGTEVVTDVLFFRKRMAGEEVGGVKWLDHKEVTANNEDGQPQTDLINEYFVDHPEMVLGEHSFEGSMYAANQYTVTPKEGDIEEQFQQAVKNLPTAVFAKQGKSQEIIKATAERDWSPNTHKEGSLYIHDDGRLMVKEGGAGVAVAATKPLSAKDEKWLKDYVGLRTALKQAQCDQLNAEKEGTEWETSLAELNKVYQAFVKKHGNILSFTERERVKTDEDGNEIKIVSRTFKNEKLLANDIESPLVWTLEKITDDGDIVPSKWLSERQIKPPAPPKIETLQDALMVSLDTVGSLNIDHIAELIKPVQEMSTDDVVKELGDLVYEEPGGGYIMADEYLSGNVKDKLEVATAAAADPRFARNVEALQKVQPLPLPAEKITVQIGAAWVPAEHVAAFASEMIGVKGLRVNSYSPLGPAVEYDAATHKWIVPRAHGSGSQASRAVGEWGTIDRSPAEILEAALNSETVTISKTENGPPKRTFTDKDGMAAVQAIIEKMNQAFKPWLFSDAERAKTLTDLYNAKMNVMADRVFDGMHLTTPGLSLKYKLHDHVKRAIWRIIQTGNTYLAHAVGAGKTLEMIVSAMEQKRLGRISKPMFIVPNHMLKQFSSEFLDAYPLANIMVADEQNFHSDNRRRFVAQAALNDLDAIILTHSSFGLLRSNEESSRLVLDDLLQEMQDAMDALTTGEDQHGNPVGDSLADTSTIKRIQKRMEAIEQKFYGRMNSNRDNVLDFEELGVDFLYVDEAHEFRKLDFTTNQTNLKGVDPAGSMRALDLLVKSRWLDRQRPGRSMVLASGTPITNTMAELYSIQRFLGHGGLTGDGLDNFDAWAKQFGQTEEALEANAAGGYKAVKRFSKFVNTGVLMQRVRAFMDVLTLSQLGDLIKVPKIKLNEEGKAAPQVVVTEQYDDLNEYLKGELSSRIKASEAWKPTFQQKYNPDPMIAIIGDGQLAAFDMRFIDPSLPSNPASKLNRMIDGILDSYHEHNDIEYHNPDTGEAHPIKGAAHIVFSYGGFGTQVAANRGFDARKWLRTRLIEGGIPADEIAFISDYKTSTAKQALFKEVREGKKKVMIGSPKNMGTGVNAQLRLKTLHYGMAPWYPADIEQPHGRIIRHGNQNDEIELYWYAAKGTYDESQWGMLARKSKAIEDAMTGNYDGDVEDISESSQYAMASALASGDPRALRLADLRGKVEKYNRLQQAFYSAQHQLQGRLGQIDGSWNGIPRTERMIGQLSDALGRVGETVTKENFSITIGKDTFNNESDKNNAEIGLVLRNAIAQAMKANKTKVIESNRSVTVEIAKVLGKFPVTVEVNAGLNGVYADPAIKVGEITTGLADARIFIEKIGDISESGLISRIYNAMNGLTDRKAQAESRLTELQEERKNVVASLERKFEYEKELHDAQAETNQLTLEMTNAGIELPPVSMTLDEITAVWKWASMTAPFRKTNDLTDQGGLKSVLEKDRPAFDEWFGDSKVVDENGEPLVVYSGRTREDSDVLRPGAAEAIYFTDDPAGTDGFTGNEWHIEQGYKPHVIPAYLSAPKLWDFENIEDSLAASKYFSTHPEPDMDEYGDWSSGGMWAIESDRFQRFLKRGGYDGFTALETDGKGKTYAVYSSNQIKSAIGNNGEYSGDTGDMLKSIPDKVSPDERMTVEEMKDLPYVPVEDILDTAEMSRDGSLLKMNAASHELLRRSFEESRIQKAEAEGKTVKQSDYEDLFGGEFLSPAKVEETVAILRSKAQEAESYNYPDEQVQTFKDHADMLEAAAAEGQGTAVVFILDSKLPHELFHQTDYIGAAEKTLLNRHTPEYKTKLDQHPIRQILWDKHYSKYNEYKRYTSQKALNATLRAEIPAFLLESSDAELAAMGITPEMQADYMLMWFEGYAAKNGIESLDHFDKEELDVQDFIAQVKEAYKQNGPTRKKGQNNNGGIERSGEASSDVAGNTSGQSGPLAESSGIKLTAETHFGRRIEKREIEKELGFDKDTRLRSLPLTLRRAGIDALDAAYEVFHDPAAIEAAQDLLDEHGIEGSIALLRNIPAKGLGAEHGILSFMLMKALQNHAASIRDTDPETARKHFELSLELAREHAVMATSLGQYTRVPSIVGPSVETLMYAIQGIIEARGTQWHHKTMTPEAWENIEAMGRRLETALTKVEDLRRQNKNKQAKIKRLEDEKEGKRRRRTATGTANRQRLVDLVKDDKKRVSGVSDARQRLLAKFQDSVNALKSILGSVGVTNLPGAELKLEQRNIAEEMLAKGIDAKKVWLATGWEKGTDGKWKTELPDNDFKVKGNLRDGGMNGLNEVIEFPELFKAYPQLSEVSLWVSAKGDYDGGGGGEFDPTLNTISIDGTYSDAYIRSAVLHEIQHAIQHIEGFATGSSPEWERNVMVAEAKTRLAELRKPLPGKDGNVRMFNASRSEQDAKDWKEIARLERLIENPTAAQRDMPRRRYMQVAGEVEARNVENRAGMSEDQRQFRPLSETEDTPRSKQTVRFDSDKSAALKSVLPEDGEIDNIPTLAQSDPEALADFSEVGAMMLTEGLSGDEEYLPSDFKAEMLAEYGSGIEPYFDEIYKAAWAKRTEWLNQVATEQTKERIENKYNEGEDLADWEVAELLGKEKLTAKRRRFIEKYHAMTVGAKKPKKNIDAYKAIITDLTQDKSDATAIAAISFAEGVGTAEIHRRFVDAGVTKAGDQRKALREGNVIWEKAKVEFTKQQEADANEILKEQGELRTIDELQWIARNELQASQRVVADEIRRIKNGEGWYRLSQLTNVLNASRTMMASFDFSGALRQGGFFTYSKPEMQGKAFANMFKAIGEKGFGRAIQDLEASANFVLSQRMGIDYAVAGKADEGSMMGEELFRGEKTIENVPIIGKLVAEGVVKWSERTYTAFLDTQRYIMADLFAKELMAAGMTFRSHPEEFKKIGDFINIATGRGVMPSNKWAKLLMDLPLFAPRYTLSRFQLINMTLNPVAYANMPPAARKIVAKQALRFYGTTMGILGLAAAVGAALGVSIVSGDPDDDDFGKITVGNTKYDIFVGMLPTAKLLIKIVHSAIRTKGGFDNRVSGEFGWDIWNGVTRFARGKLSPAASLATDVLSGKDYVGNKTELLTDIGGYPVPGKAIYSRLIPLVFNDMYEAYKLDGAIGIVKSTPLTMFGVGVSNYKPRAERPETPAEKLAAKMSAWDITGESKLTKEARELKSELVARSRRGEDVSAEVAAAVKAGVFGDYHKREILSAAKKTLLEDKAEGLKLDYMETLLRYANPDEAAQLMPLINRKMKDADEKGELKLEQRTRLEGKGASIVGFFPMPDVVKEQFDTLGLKIPDVGDSMTLEKGGPKTKLEYERYDRFRREALQKIYADVEELTKDPEYQKESDDEKRRLVKKAINKGRNAERKETKRELAPAQ